MPYTRPNDRTKFVEHINDAVQLIAVNNKSFYLKGDYFGYVVNRLVVKYLQDPEVESKTVPVFYSASYPEELRKGLLRVADKMASLMNSSDPIASAGDLNYCITAMMLGVAGEAEGVDMAKYGQRAYLRGVVDTICKSLSLPNMAGAQAAVMASRRLAMVRGVLGDVVDEWYAMFMRPFEDSKLLQNGDIWVDGKLFLGGGKEQNQSK